MAAREHAGKCQSQRRRLADHDTAELGEHGGQSVGQRNGQVLGGANGHGNESSKKDATIAARLPSHLSGCRDTLAASPAKPKAKPASSCFGARAVLSSSFHH